MQSDRWIEKGAFRSETKSGSLPQSKKCLFDPIFFDRAIQSAHPFGNVGFVNRIRGSDCSIENVFEAHRISHHPRKHTIIPYISSDAGLTATILLLLLLLTATRRGTFCFPPASSAYRYAKAAVRVIDDPSATPLLQQVLLSSLWRLSTKPDAITATMKRMRAPRAPNERLARGKGATRTCLSTASSS